MSSPQPDESRDDLRERLRAEKAAERAERAARAQRRQQQNKPPMTAKAGTTSPGQSQSAGARDSRTHRPRNGSEGLPKYQQMTRAEARIRPDQMTDLFLLRRDLSAARVNRTERITDNTLIRVAIDLLIAHRDRLHGDTEDQLRQSVLSPPGAD